MTVKQLIEHLSGLDPNSEVVVNYPSGDYHRTELARAPHSARYESIIWSSYHETHKLLDDDEQTREKIDIVVCI